MYNQGTFPDVHQSPLSNWPRVSVALEDVREEVSSCQHATTYVTELKRTTHSKDNVGQVDDRSHFERLATVIIIIIRQCSHQLSRDMLHVSSSIPLACEDNMISRIGEIHYMSTGQYVFRVWVNHGVLTCFSHAIGSHVTSSEQIDARHTCPPGHTLSTLESFPASASGTRRSNTWNSFLDVRSESCKCPGLVEKDFPCESVVKRRWAVFHCTALHPPPTLAHLRGRREAATTATTHIHSLQNPLLDHLGVEKSHWERTHDRC
jgi:hypothetical protein